MGKTYVGVGSKAQEVKKIYVGVNGIARQVKRAYVGVNGVARLIYSADPELLYLLQRSSDGASYDENTSVTGGWTLSTSPLCQYHTYNNKMMLQMNNKGNIITKNPIKTSGYTKICIDFSGYEVSARYENGTYTASERATTTAQHTVEISINSSWNNKKIQIYAANNNITVYNIWLE